MNLKSFGKALGCSMLAATLAFAAAGCGSAEKESSGAKAEAQTMTKLPQFSTKDLAGNAVTNDIFAKKKLTVVNIWGTFCPPCIGEMPELGKWAKEMPADAQIIGIVCDMDGEGDSKTQQEALRILKEAGADFVNLVPDKELMKYLDTVDAVPTTIFVDSSGNLVGHPVIGADVDAYKKAVKDYLK